MVEPLHIAWFKPNFLKNRVFRVNSSIINEEFKKKIEEEEKHIVQVHQEEFSGSLPHPNHLKRYQDISSDFPERILQMTEKQSDHRQKCERILVNDIKRGQIFAFILTLSFLGIGTILLWFEKNVGGLFTSIAALSPLISAFVYRYIESKKEKQDK